MTRFPILVFLTFLGLVGCDTHSEQVWDDVAHQVQPPKGEQTSPAGQTTAVLINKDSSTPQEQSLADRVPARSQIVPAALEPSSLGDSLTLNSANLYLSKAGELLGDFTIRNKNVVSVSHITVHCVEYNMNHSPIRETSVTWSKSLRAGESGYWDEANFGYVHNDFDTVQCDITHAKGLS